VPGGPDMTFRAPGRRLERRQSAHLHRIRGEREAEASPRGIKGWPRSSARARPNTLLATAFDLKVFFDWARRESADIRQRDVSRYAWAPRFGPCDRTFSHPTSRSTDSTQQEDTEADCLDQSLVARCVLAT